MASATPNSSLYIQLKATQPGPFQVIILSGTSSSAVEFLSDFFTPMKEKKKKYIISFPPPLSRSWLGRGEEITRLGNKEIH